MRSRDPSVMNKCWLFIAMSLMQQKELKKSRNIILKVHSDSKSDEVITKMCKGIWARLQHAWKHNKGEVLQ